MQSIDPVTYPEQLAEKLVRIQQTFESFNLPEIAVFESAPSNYRMRAEFRIWHEDDQAHFAMNHPGEKKPYIIESFPQGSVLINQLMTLILPIINQSDVLKNRLFSMEFLTTLSGEAVITLIYHRKLDEVWEQQAAELKQQLGIDIIGRSRKQKVVVGNDFVIEKLLVDEREYSYQQVETGFTQPNALVNEKMLSWANNCATDLSNDLLELYCGNGNFTCVLAGQFNRVLATEISKVSTQSAKYNLDANGISNVDIVRMASEEMTQALNGDRPFRRLKEINLDSFQFSTIFVDPPRSGLDPESEKLAARFDNILYISCNPDTLKQNLETLTQTHQLMQFAVFDQFPYTHHIECGVWLQRNALQR